MIRLSWPGSNKRDGGDDRGLNRSRFTPLCIALGFQVALASAMQPGKFGPSSRETSHHVQTIPVATWQSTVRRCATQVVVVASTNMDRATQGCFRIDETADANVQRATKKTGGTIRFGRDTGTRGRLGSGPSDPAVQWLEACGGSAEMVESRFKPPHL